MLVAAASFAALLLLPVNFVYWQFALILLLNGIGMGLFASPNRAGIMNSLPPEQRGVGAGMSATFQNSAMVLSIGIFFTLIILGPGRVTARHAAAMAWSPRACLPPTRPGSRRCRRSPMLFASLLGYNPVQTLLGTVIRQLPASPRRLPDRPFVLPRR